MLPRWSPFLSLSACLAVATVFAACQRVPLLAPTGSTITLTASTTALSANGTTQLIAQVIEPAGTPPHTGTHITFTTTLGRVEPGDATTDINGRVNATFFAGGANGTATITALSGGATTGTLGAVKIAVGTAAVGRVSVAASPSSVPSVGGSTTISALVLDVNGNALTGTPVTFTTTAGTLSAGVVSTDGNGIASSILTTNQQASVTASVGAQTPGTGTGTGTTTPSASGQASGTVTVNISGAPGINITPPATVTKGLPASFTVTVTAATANASAIREVTINWGDGIVQNLGSFTGGQVQTHVYGNDGSFLVTATVTDVVGGTNTSSSSITVQPLARPSILVNPTPATQNVGETVTFAITIVPPFGIGVRSTSIDYGDGTSESLGGLISGSKVHVYQTTGTKQVTVTVLDTANQTSTGSTSVKIIP